MVYNCDYYYCYFGQCGNTPLITASAKGRIEVVKILLTYGADVNDYNKVSTIY